MSNDLERVEVSPSPSPRKEPWLGLLARWAAAGMFFAIVGAMAAMAEERAEIKAERQEIAAMWPVVFSPNLAWSAREVTIQGRTPLLPVGWAAATGKFVCGGVGKQAVQCSLPAGEGMPELCVAPEPPPGKWPGGAPYGIRPVHYLVPFICPKNLPVLPAGGGKK